MVKRDLGYAAVIAAIAVISVVQNVSNADLIVNLDFENGFADSSGTGIDGTPVGDTSIVFDAARNSNLVTFDGDDDIISLSPQDFIDAGFDLLDEITVAMWVNTSQDLVPLAFSGGMNTDWAAGGVHLKMDNGVVNVGINGGSGDVVGTTLMPIGEWHHIAVSASLIDFIFAVYYDGVEEGIQAPTNVPDFFDMALNPNIGAWNNGGDIQREWLGLKDDVRIYSNALTPEEVTELFETTAVGDGGSDVNDWSLY